MANVEAGPVPFFTGDHRECDEEWAQVEAARPAERAKRFAIFRDRLERHLKMEEEVLFPALENATGMHGGGPTEVMRHEHRQMRALLADMDARAASNDLEGLLDQGDTLLMLIQQHNSKEEGIVYPMAQQVLGGAWGDLAAKLKAY